MKTKAEKNLLIICVVLTVTTIVLALTLIFFNPKEVVPNKDKFIAKEDDGFLPLNKSVGDGLFSIGYDSLKPYLRINYMNDASHETILSCLTNFDFENEILYCYAEDGYAIVYPESNLCKAFITPPSNPEYEGLHWSFLRDEKNNYCIPRLSQDKHLENKFVVYLNSFDEFTEYEQKMLKALE